MRGTKPKLLPIEGGLSNVPAPPAWLRAEAKVEWRRVLPGLIARRTITNDDIPTVENYCQMLGTVRAMQALIAKEGEMIPTAHGKRRHPAYQTLFQALAETRRLAAELGLTPASRGKAPPASADDDLSDLDL
jgi:P27 family predicted phage terminase small subunit